MTDHFTQISDIIKVELPNGALIQYRIANGTAYHIDTCSDVVRTIENARLSHRRIRVYYGDVKTGRDWGEIHDVRSYVSRSCGSKVKIPILLYNSRSRGGSAILDQCIIRIDSTRGRNIYMHPSYHVQS